MFSIIKKIDIYWQMIISLALITAYAIANFPSMDVLLQVAMTIAAAGVLDFAIKYFKYKSKSFPKTAVITGFFVSMILDFSRPLYVPTALAVIAIILKHAVKYKGKNIFNPAALGLFAGLFLFGGIGHSWWAAFHTPLILVLGLLVAYKFKRLQTVFLFLLIFDLINFIMNPFLIPSSRSSFEDVLSSIFNPTVAFLAFFMLIEPKSSPVFPKSRLIYALIAAVSLNFLNTYFGAGALVGSILVANFFTPFLNERFRK